MFLTYDRWYPRTRILRDEFEARFSNPESVHAGRFVWDFWHLSEQYRHLRCPAHSLFGKRTWEHFQTSLLLLAQEHFGHVGTSEPWASCYVDGCYQNLHMDGPHGHLAWVYSLTPWGRHFFEGGRTLLLRDEVLDYWNQQQSFRGQDQVSLWNRVEPKMGRLTVFDPRIPHAVEEVKGARDVLEGRLVLHGWFQAPTSRVSEGYRTKDFDQLCADLWEFLEPHSQSLSGFLYLRGRLETSGAINRVKLGCSTLRSSTLNLSLEKLNNHVVQLAREFLSNKVIRKSSRSARSGEFGISLEF